MKDILVFIVVLVQLFSRFEVFQIKGYEGGGNQDPWYLLDHSGDSKEPMGAIRFSLWCSVYTLQIL